MKVFISVDMEGLAYIHNWRLEKSNKSEVSRIMAEQLSYVIEGIKQSPINSKIEEILIADSHAQGDIIPYNFGLMDDRITLIRGTPRPNYMMSGLNDKFCVVFFVGYHGGKGSAYSNMDHTYSSSSFNNIWLNDQLMNELLINSAYAAIKNVPIGLITGDLGLKKQLQHLDQLTQVPFVITKEGLGRYSAKNYSLKKIKEDTINKTKTVLSGNLKNLPIYKMKGPYTLTIELTNTAMADLVSFMPDVKRVNGQTIKYTHSELTVLFNAITAINHLASSARNY